MGWFEKVVEEKPVEMGAISEKVVWSYEDEATGDTC